MYIDVLPEYAEMRGRDAIVGKINLYRHFKSSVSSVKPKNTMKQTEKRAELNIEWVQITLFIKD